MPAPTSPGSAGQPILGAGRLYLPVLALLISAFFLQHTVEARKRSVDEVLENNPLTNSIDFIWSTQQVATGDTAVLHCSFDAIFSQLRNGNIDWVKEGNEEKEGKREATLIASGKKVLITNRRYRVYRPHRSALSVLIIRRAKERDAGIYRCNLSGSSTRHKYLILNVTESKIEAQTSPARLKARIGKEVTLWCNATGYPRPVVYWTREDSNRKLPDGSYQFWGNGLLVPKAAEYDTGIYACYLDNFVQPVVSYKFNLVVEDRPWHLDGFKMRFDSSQWFPYNSREPIPEQGKSYLLMCETRGMPKPLPNIQWFKDGRKLRNNRHFYIIEDRPEWRNGYVSSTLVIMKFVPRHRANYTCHASNSFRTKTRVFIVTDYDPYRRGPWRDDDNAIDNMPGDADDYIPNILDADILDETDHPRERRPVSKPSGRGGGGGRGGGRGRSKPAKRPQIVIRGDDARRIFGGDDARALNPLIFVQGSGAPPDDEDYIDDEIGSGSGDYGDADDVTG